MSFVCDDCRNTIMSERGIAIGRSYGGCEFCHYVDACHDLKHYQCKKD